MRRIPHLLVPLLALLAACGDDTTPTQPDVHDDVIDPDVDAGSDADDVDVDADVDSGDGGGVDVDAGDTGLDADTGDGPDPLVEIPFDAWLPEPGEGNVRAFRVEREDELIEGMSAQGRVGDWVLENDVARFLIEDVDRTMSPCPFGGNIIDATYLGDGPREETVGEVCLLVNLGQTFRAQRFEVLEDGSDGRALIAAHGDLQQLDFLDIPAMASGLLGGLTLDLALAPTLVRPIGVTVYYALVPGENSVRVVTAMRNDGDERHFLASGHLLRPAGQGVFYNPLNRMGGYGYESLGVDNLSATPVWFTGYAHDKASWAYIPDPVEPLAQDLGDVSIPVGAGSVSVAGVTATLAGALDILGVLLAQPGALPTTRGVSTLEPGDVTVLGYHFAVGDGSLDRVIGAAYRATGLDAARVGGVVRGAGGAGVPGVRVTAVDGEGRGLGQALTDADGRYTLHVLAGVEYELRAYVAGRNGVAAELLTPEAGASYEMDIDTAEPATLNVRVTTPDGEPTVARVTVTCDGACPRPLGAERDLIVDDIPGEFAALVPTGVDGRVSISLEPGRYGVVVSRGLEWSIWPSDAPTTGGAEINVAAGDVVALDAEIAHVVDTSGALSADFHIHAIASSDSSVSDTDRVWQYASEGVDMMVSTDHDYIVDHAPLIAAAGLDEELTSMVGVEITTSSYGHINAFPLEVDADSRTGGALDWGNDTDKPLLPAETYAWAHAYPGEQVVQINHPEDTGTIGALDADVLLGISRASAESTGLPEQPVDEETGDTGLWSEDFTAMEVMNGLATGVRNTRFRWWLTMVGRGFTPTATAVTDTHKLYSDLGGVPRTYAFVPEARDTPWTLDPAEFVSAINGGQAIGTNGPYFRPTLRTDADGPIGPGGTITNGAGLTLDVAIELPTWIEVDTIDLYVNATEGIYSRSEDDSPVLPTSTHPVSLSADDLEVAVASDAGDHLRYRKVVSIPLELSEDAYVVVVLRGTDQSMWPVVPSRGARPFAFSNPIYVDANGGGYDTWPLQAIIDQVRARSAPPAIERDALLELGDSTWTREWAGALIDRASCDSHGHDAAEGAHAGHDHR